MQPVITTSAMDLAIGLVTTIAVTGVLVAATISLLIAINDPKQLEAKTCFGKPDMRPVQSRIKEDTRRHHLPAAY